MAGLIGVLLRVLAGLVALALCWAALDQIHDRKTELAAAAIGLGYCLFAASSRRWDPFGLALLSLVGVALASWRNEPFDAGLRGEAGFKVSRGGVFVARATLAALAALCAFRFATSLSGQGWDRFSQPLRAVFTASGIGDWLGRL